MLSLILNHMQLLTSTMSLIGSPETILGLAFTTLCFLYFVRLCVRSGQPCNWPLVGMVPQLLLNLNRLPDKAMQMLEVNNGTFKLKSIWFANLDMIITSDPVNVHHIMSTNYSNYPRGPESARIFDVLGHFIFNVDTEPEWKDHKKILHTYFNDKRFSPFIQKINRDCLVNGLMPVLEHVSEQGLVVDLQDVFQRFMFDAIAMMLTGYDPAALRVGFPDIASSSAMDDATRAIFLRHIMPETCWKLLMWLGLGAERKMSKAAETMDDMAKNYIDSRRQELLASGGNHDLDERFDLLKCYLTKDVVVGGVEHSNTFLRDCIVGVLWAGRDAPSTVLSWFFWLVSKNPSVENNIKEELRKILPMNNHRYHEGNDQNYQLFETEDLSKLVYLHATFCETLRLYSSAPFQRRSPIKPDILPSGHQVGPNTKVVVSSYAVARMKSIWGEDCLEFKPERWLTGKGSIMHVPSNKFLAFSSGPRKCSAIEMSFVRMKYVAAAIIQNYNVEVIKDQEVVPTRSVILRMKHGLKVKITKRVA